MRKQPVGRRDVRDQQHARSLELALAAARAADDSRGKDIVILDMRELTPIFDYFVLATGASRRQVHAISDAVDDVLEKVLGDRRLGREGYEEASWILLDYGSVVIHLFTGEAREYYDLEQLWCGAKNVPFEPQASESLSA